MPYRFQSRQSLLLLLPRDDDHIILQSKMYNHNNDVYNHIAVHIVCVCSQWFTWFGGCLDAFSIVLLAPRCMR